VLETMNNLGKSEVFKTMFPEVLPLCCAVLCGADICARLHRNVNYSALFHVLK